MAIKVWNGSSFVDVENVSYWNGSSWATAEAVHQWDGSAWEKVWPEGVVPTFVGAEDAAGTGSSLAIDVPTGVQDDDEMLSLLANISGFGLPTDPAGWTALDTASSSSARASSSRRTASSEPSSYTWTGLQNLQAARGVNLAVRNVGATYASSIAAAFGGSTATAPSINVTGATDLVVAVGLSTGTNTPDTPSGFTSVFSAQGVRIATATPGVGATGTVQFTGFSGSAHLAALFAMAPS